MKRKITFLIAFLILNFMNSQTNLIQIGAKGHDGIYDLVTDQDSNIYMTGFFQGKFNGLVAKGGTDAFISKIDSKNNVVWFKQIGSDFRNKKEITEFGKFIALDSNNNVYVLGLYYNELNFSKNQKINSNGKQDMFIAKFNSNGVEQWVKTYGEYNNESIKKLVIDEDDNIYVFSNLAINNSRLNDVNTVLKFNSLGDLLWSNEIIINNSTDINVIQIEYKHNYFYVIGENKGEHHLLYYNIDGIKIKDQVLIIDNEIISFAIDERKDIYLLEMKNKQKTNKSYAIRKINSKGEKIWSKKYSNIFKPNSIALHFGEMYLIGSSRNIVTLSSSSSLFKYNLDGELILERTLIGENQNKINKHFIDNKSIYLVGQFYNQLELDDINLLSFGKTDSFITIQSLSNQETDSGFLSDLAYIYPNPNNGEFYIKNINQVEKIEIYDLNGKLVFQKENILNPYIQVNNVDDSVYNTIIYKKNGERKLMKLLIIN